jgi:hypothetical protein
MPFLLVGLDVCVAPMQRPVSVELLGGYLPEPAAVPALYPRIRPAGGQRMGAQAHSLTMALARLRCIPCPT